MNIVKVCVVIGFLITIVFEVKAQNDGVIRGNFFSTAQYYITDSLIGTTKINERMLSQSFINLLYQKNNFTAGIRYESYLNALSGYDPNYTGIGIPYRFASYQLDELEITAGNFYEQFGSGMLLCTFEDKNLGYDNSFDGTKIKYRPTKGMLIKGLVGKQRLYFTKGEGIVRAIDAEIGINELFNLSDTIYKTQCVIGASFVSRYEKDADPIYILPENVAAWASRIRIINGGVNFNLEYAFKINDPSSDNHFIYKNGNGLWLNTSYSIKRFSFFITLKRIDNMSFRSSRTAMGNNLFINYIPPVTKTSTYSLLSLYPYATQTNGEAGAQIEIQYSIKKDSYLGGKNGATIIGNFSRIHNIAHSPTYDGTGYKSDIWSISDELFFQDVTFELQKKCSNKLKCNFLYKNIQYNKSVIEDMAGMPIIKANAAVIETMYKLNKKKACRIELQTLFTKQDKGDWLSAMVEYTIVPYWSFSISDSYNYGNNNSLQQLHYPSLAVGYTKNANTIRLSYGRTFAAIYCEGGICRYLPATNGVSLTVSSSF